MDYDFRLHPVTGPDPANDEIFTSWMAAVRRGFHQDRITDTQLTAEAAIAADEGWKLRGAYADSSPQFAIAAAEPVATFTEWTGELSLGGGHTLPLHQISDVTVRPTHRRQGFLRRLMTESLTRAKESGIAVAGLTATEATIYGRFGFGPATFHTSIEVDAGPRFALRRSPGGRVEFVTLDGLAEVADQVFDQFHQQQAGSVRRVPARRKAITGALDRDTMKPSEKMRAAAHWDADGQLDGYITWLYVGEFTHQRIEIVDLVAVSDRAHLALWEFIGSIDLVEKVTWSKAADDDPLHWALADRRAYSVTGTHDNLWLRVLDPAAAFSARRYARDGHCSFRVVDPMGFAEGTWELTVRDGQGTVQTTQDADLEVDAEALGSVLLGGVHLGALAAADLVRGPQEAVDQLNMLLQARRSPRCLTGF